MQGQHELLTIIRLLPLFVCTIFVKKHPVCTKFVAELGKPGGKKSLFHLHKDLAAFRK